MFGLNEEEEKRVEKLLEEESTNGPEQEYLEIREEALCRLTEIDS